MVLSASSALSLTLAAHPHRFLQVDRILIERLAYDDSYEAVLFKGFETPDVIDRRYAAGGHYLDIGRFHQVPQALYVRPLEHPVLGDVGIIYPPYAKALDLLREGSRRHLRLDNPPF